MVTAWLSTGNQPGNHSVLEANPKGGQGNEDMSYALSTAGCELGGPLVLSAGTSETCQETLSKPFSPLLLSTAFLSSVRLRVSSRYSREQFRSLNF